MNIKSIGSFLFLVIILSGCSTGNHISYSSEAYDKADITFVGIPTILGLGMTGTTFPISRHYSLTAKHVAKYTFNSVLAYHPTCDIAIIKKDNSNVKSFPIFTQSYYDEQVVNYGYSFISAMPVSSIGNIKIKTSLDDYSYGTKDCSVIFSTNGVISGMSGGPVYNSHQEVVGVNIASFRGKFLKNEKSDVVESKDFDLNENHSGLFFVNMYDIKNWLIDEINKTEDKGMIVFK